MALVVSAPSLLHWSRPEPVVPDEKRPSERARAASSSTSPSPPSSRRTSTSSSNADTMESSGGDNSFDTQQSGSSDGVVKLLKTSKRKRHKGADIVLHVENCAFAVDSHVLKHKCHTLHRLIMRLRDENAVGRLASGDADCDQDQPSHSPPLQSSFQFALQQRDPLSSVAAAAQRHGRCPLISRHRTSQSLSPSSRSVRFPKVRCVAHTHQRSRDDAVRHDSQEQRSPPELRQQQAAFSPGKENYVGSLSTGSTVRTQPQALPRVVLAPKLPFTIATSRFAPARRGASGAVPTILTSNLLQSPATTSSPPRNSHPVAPDAFAVELIGASADAMATFIEFLYSGTTSGLDAHNAATVTRLCQWFCVEDHLLYAALIMRARNLDSVEQWMDILLCCTKLRIEAKKKILVHHLLTRLIKLTPTQFRNAMSEMPLQRLAAIDDADVLALVLTCMTNTVRSMEIWNRLVFALELWLDNTFPRPFAMPVPLDHPDSVPTRQPMSLLEFHQKFVTWNPVLRVGKMITGIDAYVKARTLFEFGPFVFQVRLEPNQKPLMLWRVLRAGLPSDNVEDVELGKFRAGMEPSFTIRGRLSIVYQCTPTDPVLYAEAPVRYSHSAKWYGKWQVLLAGPTPSSSTSAAARASQAEPESEEKTQEPEESYQEETAPLGHDSDSEPDAGDAKWSHVATSGVQTPPIRTTSHPLPLGTQSQPSSSQDSPFDPITCHFSGQFSLWGHRVCNLYHFLLVSTLFYLTPHGAPPEMAREAVQTRMRELPVDTLIFVLQSDRLCVPDGETTLAAAVATLCLHDYGTVHYSVEQIRSLLQCVRWCFVDLEQIMTTLEYARRELRLYELIEQDLRHTYEYGSTARRAPWGVDEAATPYRVATTLVEFQIEAGDRSLSPSKFLSSQE